MASIQPALPTTANELLALEIEQATRSSGRRSRTGCPILDDLLAGSRENGPSPGVVVGVSAEGSEGEGVLVSPFVNVEVYSAWKFVLCSPYCLLLELSGSTTFHLRPIAALSFEGGTLTLSKPTVKKQLEVLVLPLPFEISHFMRSLFIGRAIVLLPT